MRIKKLLPLAVILFVVSVALSIYNFVSTGDFIIKDVDLKGGTLVSLDIDHPADTKVLEDVLNQKYGSAIVTSLKTAKGYGVNIQISQQINENDVISIVENTGVKVLSSVVQTVGPTLGEAFYKQITYSVIAAFVLMSVVIFVVYRNPLSSGAMIFAVAANIISTLAFTTLLGIRMSFASLAAILMLIGYTVDSNIILTHRVARVGLEGFEKEYKKALTTGLTLTATITITMIIVLIVSQSKLLSNIAEILTIGFLTDLAYTWIMNASLLEIWMERKFK